MLRHRLFMVLGSLLLLLLVTAAGAIWALQRVLTELHLQESQAWVAIDQTLSKIEATPAGQTPGNTGQAGDQLQLSRQEQSRIQADHTALLAYFHRLVLVISIAFIVLINVLVVVLLRTAAQIVQPVEELIEGTRELSHEHFDHRVQIEQNDEFGELARAYNDLAGRLQVNEQRRLETLGQAALTLNHELNNAAETIELQLQLLRKQSGKCKEVDKYAHQIREGLARMSSTVNSLKRVRRIVLTDYVSGVKMLDLERSVRDDEHAEEPMPSHSA
jgi:methyl-accepting chemotaxis protein